MTIGHDSYEITIPRLAPTFVGTRQIGMELYQGERPIATLQQGMVGTTEKSTVKWSSHTLYIEMQEVGKFLVSEDGKEIGRISVGLTHRQRQIEFDDTIPLEIRFLCFWGTIRRLHIN